MDFKNDFSLKEYNTFGLEAKAASFVEVQSTNELQKLLKSQRFKLSPNVLILGGGSNILLTRDFQGLVVKISIKGKEIIKEDENHAWIKCGAGEVWHEFVLYTLSKGYGGIENLSLIPGTVGAAPMQNIGAYGIEIKEVFDHLEAVHIATGNVEIFDKASCQFGYRDSIFKQHAKGKYIITNVAFKLTKKDHQLNLDYGAIRQTLEEKGITDPTIHDISEAVIKIRRSKLPDPTKIGNAGSFFKNPVISEGEFQKVLAKFPEIPHYKQNNNVKVPAGWLIEQCGWKGYRRGPIGVHKLQALVLVNEGGGKGEDLQMLAEEIKQSVKDRFGIDLDTEVNFI